MHGTAALPVLRDDFRCSLCRQKNAFHCEHDTPYRDQLIGSYDPEKPRVEPITNRKEPKRISVPKVSSSKKKRRHTNPVQQSSSNFHSSSNNSWDNGSHTNRTRKLERTPVSYAYTNSNQRHPKNEQKKKSGGCTIL